MSTDAERHIQKIRKEKGVEEGGDQSTNVTTLNATLNIVAEQLYSNSIHFVLELIQNADDNEFHPAETPQLSFIYGNGWIQTRCNETGFTRANVDAICNAGKSTKTVVAKERGFIGEKGIGFKSVFKVAEVVWLYSREYSFKFVRDNILGMINPIWDTFPREYSSLESGTTAIHMQLSPSCDQDQLRGDLYDLDAKILLFLRKLKVLAINPSSELEASRQHVKYERIVTPQNDQDVVCLKTSTDGNETTDFYVIVRRPNHEMPKDERREGIVSSEVVLGFPVDRNHEPVLQPQLVYAFLPIRAYGFTFIIHADFLLVASREEIDSSKPWNSKLRSEVTDAFVQAVDQFNYSALKFTWPRYLRTNNLPRSFFDTIIVNIRSKLRTRNILFSWSNDSQQPKIPTSLKFVPNFAKDDAGEPLVGSKVDYLSPNYEFNDVSSLGVKQLTYGSFVSKLKAFIEDEYDSYRSKPHRWHCRVALALYNAKRLDPEARYLRLIPLRDGEWVSGERKDIYFEELNEGMRIPGDVEPPIVERSACASSERRRLFQSLGVKTLDLSTACQLIGNRHQYSTDHSLTVDDMVDHASFLFHAAKTVRRIPLIKFAMRSGNDCWGKEAYLDLPNSDYPVSSFFTKRPSKVNMIDSKYFEVDRGELSNEWIAWLQDSQHVSAIPRLCSDERDITPEFEFIMKKEPIKCLKLLRDNWRDYYWKIINVRNVKEDLSRMSVPCTDGKYRPLRKTFLPAVARENGTIIPTIHLLEEEAERSTWNVLELLGVGTTPNLRYYILLLKEYREKDSASNNLLDIYEGLQQNANDDRNLLRSTFESDSFIRVFSSTPNPAETWVRLKDCVWKTEPCLKRPYCLFDLYPTCKELFHHIVDVPNANVDTVIDELYSIQGVDAKRDPIKDIFVLLNKLLKHNRLKSSHWDVLERRKIFPVYKIDQDGNKNEYFLHYKDMWCVPDQRYWTRAFHRRIPLLDFSEEVIGKLSNLIGRDGLDLKYRKLSKVAVEETSFEGDIIHHTEFTKSWHEKSELILNLVSPRILKLHARQIRNLMVYSVSSLILSRKLRYPNYRNTVIEGTDGDGTIILKMEDDAFEVYMSAKDITSRESLAFNNFARELANTLEIDEPDKMNILASIIASEDIDRLKQELDRMNIPPPRSPARSPTPSIETSISQYRESTTGNPCNDARYQYAHERHRAPAIPTGYSRPTEALRPSFEHSFTLYDVPDMTTLDNIASQFDFTTASLVFDQTTTVLSSTSSSDADFSSSSETVSSLESRHTRAHVQPTFPVARSKERFSIDQDIGFCGEYFIHRILTRVLGRRFEESHWTSRMRKRAGLSPFTQSEGDFSDFTYYDRGGTLTQHFVDWGWPRASDWIGNPVTYHLEVKSTTGHREVPFFMSYNQFQMARRWALPQNNRPSDVYAIFRVYGLNADNAQFQVYPDPWNMFLADQLQFRPQGSFVVTPTF